jgi:hypothetical protein
MTLLLGLSVAHACGGFFCNQSMPVDQSGETIVFAVDHAAETVTMHVQVAYAGPAEEFAWVVPVNGEPDVFLGHSALFTTLAQSAPRWFWISTDQSTCSPGRGSWSDADADADADADSDADSDADTDADGGVTVLAHDLVGAYDVTTLAGDDPEVLVAWLQDNDYEVPDTLADTLAPYIAADQNLLALKLRKDASDGALAPLALRYPGTRPAIPIGLTAVAAQPDMPLNVYILGDARAVPTNYLHVRVNPVAIDYWSWSPGANYDGLITLAADEAGGQAFATDAVLDARMFDRSVYAEGMYNLDRLRDTEGAAAFVGALPLAGFFGTDEVMSVLQEHVPVPEDFRTSAADFYNCPVCYADDYARIDFDLSAAIAALVEVEVEPRRSVQALLDGASLTTRLRSSMSPDEMTVDPVFGFNPDLSTPVDLTRLDNEVLCDGARVWGSKQRLQYAHGLNLVIPSARRLATLGLTPFEYVSQAEPSAALLVEQLGTTGQGTVLVDHRGALQEALDALNVSSQHLDPGDLPGLAVLDSGPGSKATGCGCSAGGSTVGWWGMVPLVALWRRSRRG